MTTFQERQKAEAISRMRKLKLHKNAIKEFDKEGKINFSEWIGALYWADEKLTKILDEFKKSYPDLLPYHAIHNNTEFGELYSILYVSGDEEEWRLDNDDISDGYAMSYVYNCTEPTFSEFGSIAIKPSFGGLIRVG